MLQHPFLGRGASTILGAQTNKAQNIFDSRQPLLYNNRPAACAFQEIASRTPFLGEFADESGVRTGDNGQSDFYV